MTEAVIRVENLGKRYTLGQSRESSRYKTLRDTLTDVVSKPFRASAARPAAEDFWALKDVSFEIGQGEVLGIIGRNGAGKSTLLKVLSRITEPTTGRITIKGRVASLLEVGTGFHPELTGRENIYLNGAVLGMHRREIKAKFDEIVAFAEVEKFLDTPVKRYSSGMYVRLAFAVAAHLEPEILIVDEVLAVGDAEFQKKCLGKMQEVARGGGRTVLFVSHNIGVITQICSQGLLLNQGRVEKAGTVEAVTATYLRLHLDTEAEIDLSARQPADARFRFLRLTLTDHSNLPSASLDVREPVTVRLEYELRQPVAGLELTFRVINQLGIIVFSLNRSVTCREELALGRFTAEITIPEEFLVPGHYAVSLFAHVPNQEVVVSLADAAAFQIEELGSHMALYPPGLYGTILVRFPWKEQRT